MKTIKVKNYAKIPKGFTGIVEFLDGDKWWYKNGNLHREDGPAIEDKNGDKEWWINGNRHREDGPAIECSDGEKHWFKDGKCHRLDGPAIEWSNGTKYWYLEGQEYSKKEFNEKTKKPAAKKTAVKKTVTKKATVKKPTAKKAAVVTKLLKLGWEKPVPKDHTGIIVRPDKTRYWYKDGKIHREDGPAVEYEDGAEFWWFEGKRHREGGPAVEKSNGYKEWYMNGLLHREDGPACEYPGGTKHWYLEGQEYSEKEFNEKIKKPAAKKAAVKKTVVKKTATVQVLKLKMDELVPKNYTGIMERANETKHWYKEGLWHREDGPAVEFSDGEKWWYKEGKRHRVDGPAVECFDGTKQWFLHGNLHREDGPAVEFSNGDKVWYKEGKCHRLDGPACEWADGRKEWYLEGKKYSEKDFNENLKTVKVKTAAEIPDGFTGIAYFTDGSKGWLKDGKYHRDDGPALEFGNGRKCWYKDGECHREDGPAAEYEDGREEWWYKGLCFSQEEHSSLIKQANKTPQTETSKQKVLQVVVSDSKEVALRIAVQKINLLSKSILLKLFQKTKYSKMEDILNSEIGKAMLKAITSALLEMLKSKFDNKYKLVLDEISKEFRIQAETDLSVELLTKIEEYLQSSPTMSFIQTRISVENFNSEQIEVDNNQEVETTLLVSSNNSMLN